MLLCKWSVLLFGLDFEMSDTQWNHSTLVEHLVPRLAALRIELCPIHMSESYFWKVYFVLLLPRLNKHDALLLSTPQVSSRIFTGYPLLLFYHTEFIIFMKTANNSYATQIAW